MVEMVVEQSRQGFAKRYRRCDLRRKRSRERGRAATGAWDCCVQPSPSPLLYIGGKGKGLVAALGPSSKEGRRLGRKLASQGKWTPSHLEFPLSLAHGPCGAGAPDPISLGHHPTAHACPRSRRDPFGLLRNPLEPSGSFPVQYRKNPKLFW